MKTGIVVFGGGCFWCTEAIFKQIRGVVKTVPGFSGGALKNPSYHEVVQGGTGHAEVLQIEFDPSVIPFGYLLDIFFHTHDPTSLNKQDNDVGPEYRSVIFYTNRDQALEITKQIKKINDSQEFVNPIVTEVKPLSKFYPAEDYHRDYYEKNSYQPYCQIIISPKLTKLREKYRQYLVK